MQNLFGRKIKLFFMMHWLKMLIGFILIVLIVLAIWGLASLESFYRNLTLATMPINLLVGGINALIFVFLYLFLFQGGLSKMSANKVKGEKVDIKWSDVIGMDESKQEALEVVELIKDRKRLMKIGGKIIRGLLMVGPPGCGKTYLAKAIATEAKVPFLSTSGSEFTEIFVGVGPSRVRKLFKKARMLAYGHGACIIFIDELDAIGHQRSFSMMGGGQETNSTQNQLLVEMDGLREKGANVIVIGATNAAEGILDSALLRPGRFDRKIYIDRPDLVGREKVFKYYLDKVKHDSLINVSRLARKAVYKSPADIENIVKESALIATRENRDEVQYKDITEAIERIDIGVKRRRKITSREREMIAFHEAGHLIIMYLLHPTDDVFKVSIISRKETLGMVYPQPREELFTSSKDKIFADVKVFLAGYVAEKLKYGTTSDGVVSDFKGAMKIAHNMVWKFGMGKNGFIGDYTIIPETQLSENVKEKLNTETQEILFSCVKEVEEILKKEWKIVERFANELLQKEELEYDEIEEIFKEEGMKKI
ncbi:AAA family ATPase [Candidatus Kuenenbacteria bacterium]|nr:AAA family ATPase [Candidatus Kuenenbacteria bacterium]